MVIVGKFENITVEKLHIEGYTARVYLGNHTIPTYKGHKMSYTLSYIKRK